MGGYSKREVKEFLAGVADDFEEMERQNRGMQERLLQLENQVNELRQGEESLRRVVDLFIDAGVNGLTALAVTTMAKAPR